MDYIYCSKCGEKNSISEDYCIECGSILRKLDKYESGDRITSFEDMFTQKHKEQLNETPLTNEIYELILNNTSGTVHLMNEYCAHTVEGRFIPHGYQNYGSFNSILEDLKDELDKETAFISLVLGNTLAEDIIHLLEHFIDDDLRGEIKQQYNSDRLPPSYSQIGMETTDMMDENSRNELIMGPIVGSFDAAMKNPDFKNVLNGFLETFKSYNQ